MGCRKSRVLPFISNVLGLRWCKLGIEAELLPEVLLDLLQPIQAVLALEVHLRPLAMVPNDSPYPKT